MSETMSDPRKAFEHMTHPATLNRPRENWLVLYKGEPMALSTNGKFRWSKPQHALSALTHAWQKCLYEQRGWRKAPDYNTEQVWLDTFKEWRRQNVEIVTQENYEAGNA